MSRLLSLSWVTGGPSVINQYLSQLPAVKCLIPFLMFDLMFEAWQFSDFILILLLPHSWPSQEGPNTIALGTDHNLKPCEPRYCTQIPPRPLSLALKAPSTFSHATGIVCDQLSGCLVLFLAMCTIYHQSHV